MTSESTDKKQMRIALVGIAPPDQVTLKGYMRVLLRLDANLEWVAVSDPKVDLFMVNNDFRYADSIVRLLETRKSVPVLFVGTAELDGELQGDLLTLPLKQIGRLADWLSANVPVLGGVLGMGTPSVNQTSSIPQRVTPPTSQPQAHTAHSPTNRMQGIIDLIQKLQGRSKSFFEIVENGTPIAVLDGHRQVVWVQASNPVLSDLWQLRPYQGAIPTIPPQDANAWLWQVAWQTPSVVASLVGNHNRYQLRYWVKPLVGKDRRDLLQIMTAIEFAPLSVAEISAKAGVSSGIVRSAVASLLLSGNLTESSYRELQVPAVSPEPPTPEKVPAPEVVVEVVSAPEPTQATLPAKQEQQEKLGFLAKLRRKLGL